MSDQFYRAFEEKFRGPAALIQQRLSVYLPFVQPVHQAYPDVPMLDLGCGRGEWLALLQKNAITAIGVDTDAGMLEACHQQKLNVQSQDALLYLKQMSAGSASVITAFHLVEHLPFDRLKELVNECHRVLVAGGLLILETPNPENFQVATQSFYLDPTHLRPIPPDLLAFVPEYLGYETVKVVRLQESTEVKAQTNLSMLDVFEGASPDYAVVAQKAGHPNLKERLQGLFEQAFGISGHVLLERHRQQMLESRFHLEKTISNAQLRSQKAELLAQNAELLAQNAELLSAQLKARLDRLEEQGTQKSQMAYKGLLGWFILQTLRVAEQGVWTRLKALVRKLLRIIGRPVVHFVNNRPHFKMQLINLAQKLGLLPLLRSVWNRMQISATQNSHQADHPAVTTDSMSQQAQRIAQTLQNKKRT